MSSMENDAFTKESIVFIVSRLLESGREAEEEYRQDKNLFNEGRIEGYYELLDILKNELEIHQEDLKEYGLDIDLDKEFSF